MTQSNGNRRQAAVAFILVTLFIDMLGIGIIVPVLPELVMELLEKPASGMSASGGLLESMGDALAGSASSGMTQSTGVWAAIFWRRRS